MIFAHNFRAKIHNEAAVLIWRVERLLYRSPIVAYVDYQQAMQAWCPLPRRCYSLTYVDYAHATGTGVVVDGTQQAWQDGGGEGGGAACVLTLYSLGKGVGPMRCNAWVICLCRTDNKVQRHSTLAR